MAGKLTLAGIARAAAVLGTPLNPLRAVIAVEAAGDGFLPDGRPKILLERHKFHHFTGGQFDHVPRVSSPKRGGYEGDEAEYTRLYIALQLAPEAALQSCSWGLGQVMGFNWQLCGERSLYGFLLAMHHNEDAQLMLMAQFIRAIGAADELRRLDWDGFRKLYNGPASPAEYGTRLRAAFARAERQYGRGV